MKDEAEGRGARDPLRRLEKSRNTKASRSCIGASRQNVAGEGFTCSRLRNISRLLRTNATGCCAPGCEIVSRLTSCLEFATGVPLRVPATI